jgi:hypothetical protein
MSDGQVSSTSFYPQELTEFRDLHNTAVFSHVLHTVLETEQRIEKHLS